MKQRPKDWSKRLQKQKESPRKRPKRNVSKRRQKPRGSLMRQKL